MILGIDAFNLSSGGGITHLVELLRAAVPIRYGFKTIILWGSKSTLAKVEDCDWLQKVHEPLLDRHLLYRVFWHLFVQKRRAAQSGCDIVFLPGGTDFSGFSPSVTMSRNMLPFEWRELRRYGWALATLKLLLLRWTQKRSFQNTSGLIFLTQYAQHVVMQLVGSKTLQHVIIPHGINARFFHAPRYHHHGFTADRPCRVLYVSIISPYKHQWVVVEAAAKLRAEGVPITLELIGPPAEGLDLLNNAIKHADPKQEFITYQGGVAHELLEKYYTDADIGLFASSCENMPNILLEGMAAGLPMASSRMGPMPEILGDAGEYFDPLDSDDIAKALRKLISCAGLRTQLAEMAFAKAKQFSWDRSANYTFEFLAQIAQKYKTPS